jgi:subtilisin family serine protease
MRLAVLSCLAVSVAHASVVINFDDRVGQEPPFGQGIPAQVLVNTQYAGQGVTFNSGGGGVAIAHPSNPVSAPNTAGATGPGPVLSYTDNVEAMFAISGSPAVVDLVSLTLTSSSSNSTLTAYGLGGAVLGSSSGAASTIITVSFPGQIHRVVLSGGPFAFDDFTFDGLVPAPGSTLVMAGLLPMAARRRREC